MLHNELTLLRSACKVVESAFVTSTSSAELRENGNGRNARATLKEAQRIPLLQAAANLAQHADLMIGLKKLVTSKPTTMSNVATKELNIRRALSSQPVSSITHQPFPLHRCTSKQRPTLPIPIGVAHSTTIGHSNSTIKGFKRVREDQHPVNNEVSLRTRSTPDALSSSLTTKPSSQSLFPKPIVSSVPTALPAVKRRCVDVPSPSPQNFGLNLPPQERERTKERVRRALDRHSRGDCATLLSIVSAMEEQLLHIRATSRDHYMYQLLTLRNRIRSEITTVSTH